MLFGDKIPTLAELAEAENQRVEAAVRDSYVEGIDEEAWIGAAMRKMRGQCNPAWVIERIRELLSLPTELRFPKKSPETEKSP